MSGPSRSEISDLVKQYAGLLSVMYPGYDPKDVSLIYKGMEQRVRSGTGSPDLILKNKGRLLRRWIEASRGQPLVPFHQILLAAWHELEKGVEMSAAFKKARVLVKASEADPGHWLHGLNPKFVNGVLVTS